MFVDTSKYQSSHGKAPKGKGTWAFQIGHNPANKFWSKANVSYSDAKKDAVKCANGATVFVLP